MGNCGSRETVLIALFTDSFTEKEIVTPRGETVIANRLTHEEICKEFSDALQTYEYSIEKTAPLLVHNQTMKFYDHKWGMYCGDNTSLILVEL